MAGWIGPKRTRVKLRKKVCVQDTEPPARSRMKQVLEDSVNDPERQRQQCLPTLLRSIDQELVSAKARTVQPTPRVALVPINKTIGIPLVYVSFFSSSFESCSVPKHRKKGDRKEEEGKVYGALGTKKRMGREQKCLLVVSHRREGKCKDQWLFLQKVHKMDSEERQTQYDREMKEKFQVYRDQRKRSNKHRKNGPKKGKQKSYSFFEFLFPILINLFISFISDNF